MKLSEITKKGSLSLLIQFFGMALSLCLTLFMTHQIGKDGYNAYALSFSWIIFLSHIGLFGFDSLVVREMNKKTDNAVKKGLIRRGSMVGLITSALLGLALFCFAWWFYDDFGSHENQYIRPALLVSAAAVPFFSMLMLVKSYLKGIKKNEIGMIPESIVRPALVFLGLVIAVMLYEEVDPVFIVVINVCAILIALAVALAISNRHRLRATTAAFDKKYWRSAFTFLFLSFVMMANSRADMLMLGMWEHTLPDVGAYSIALKFTDFVSMPLLILNAVIAPYLVEYFEDNSLKSHLVSVKKFIRAIFAFGSVLCITYLMIPDFFLNLFGKENEYVIAASPMIVLGFGQLFNVLLGPVGNALNMAGAERTVFVVSAITLVINLGLNVLLIPFYGLMGAAIGTVSSLVCWNVILAIELKRRYGVNVSII